MRTLLLVCALLVLWCPLAAAQETEAQRQEAILKELRSLRESVDELTLRVQALEKKLGGSAPMAAAPAIPLGLPGMFQERKADPEALSKITLPANPTKEQAREYVRKIMVASQNQNSFSSDDPQVSMLEQVGPDNLVQL